MKTICDSKRIIKKHIIEDILLGDTSFEVIDETELINDNIIDSINLMKLISFIETEFNITFSNDDYSVDNFNTINDITNLIKAKSEE